MRVFVGRRGSPAWAKALLNRGDGGEQDSLDPASPEA